MSFTLKIQLNLYYKHYQGKKNRLSNTFTFIFLLLKNEYNAYNDLEFV